MKKHHLKLTQQRYEQKQKVDNKISSLNIKETGIHWGASSGQDTCTVL